MPRAVAAPTEVAQLLLMPHVDAFLRELDDVDRVQLAADGLVHAARTVFRTRLGVATARAFDDAPITTRLPEPVAQALTAWAKQFAGRDLLALGQRLGALYTRLLPDTRRTELGAYYTPEPLAGRLLDLATREGLDWSTARVLDPSCGGAAFLLPVARRMASAAGRRRLDADALLRRLHGIELDPFAAWLSRRLLALWWVEEHGGTPRALDAAVETNDALAPRPRDERWDLVVGNPPYRRMTLDLGERRRFARSVYGHANLYGLFLDTALDRLTPDGLIAFVTPTSFLGGQYFTRLRALLGAQAPPRVLEFVQARAGVFESVLQETCLAVFGPQDGGTVRLAQLRLAGSLGTSTDIGEVPQPADPSEPWLLPRTPHDVALASTAAQMRTRLEALGWRAATGPLVWNRHKTQLRREPGAGTRPLVWAEAVRADGFCFDYSFREHPFVRVLADQDFLVDRRESVLVQRTTAKEQDRRLIACVLPGDFVAREGGVVVENHVNVLRPVGEPIVSARTVAAALNTRTMDRLFRCISGSVAVSAAELHALPLPSPAVWRGIERALSRPNADVSSLVEKLVARAYGERGET